MDAHFRVPPFPPMPPIPPYGIPPMHHPGMPPMPLMPPMGFPPMPPGMMPPLPPGMGMPMPPPGFPGIPLPPYRMPGPPPPRPPMRITSQPPLALTDDTNPKNWMEFEDKERKKPYYYNLVTKKTQWRKPTGVLAKADHMKPKSATKIGETDWYVVDTLGGKTFYYNRVINETFWELPESLNTKAGDASDGEEGSDSEESGAEDTEERKSKKRKRSGESKSEDEDGEVPAKSGETGASSPKRRKAEEEPEPPVTAGPSLASYDPSNYEHKVAIFRELLKEKGVTATSTWAKSLPLITYDARFNVMTTQAERHAAFDLYVKSRVLEEKKEKLAQQKSLHDDFRRMMDEVAAVHAANDAAPATTTTADAGSSMPAAPKPGFFTHKTSYSDLKKVCGEDGRWMILSSKERETLLNERIAPLKEANARLKQRAEGEFNQLLKESEKITADSHWGDVKKELERDTRYNRGILSPDDREDLFRTYRKKLDKEEDSRRRKRDLEERSLRDRERSGRATKEDEEHRMRVERQKLALSEEVSNIKVLYQERVHDPNARWADVAKALETDRRFQTKILGRSDLQRMLEDHTRRISRNAPLPPPVEPETGRDEPPK